MNNFNDNDTKQAFEAKSFAQFIAFSPVIFQISRCMIKFGVLDLLHDNQQGLEFDELCKMVNLSEYSLKILLESSLSFDVVKLIDNKYQITKTGYYLCKDFMTKVNLNFNHFVNYNAFFYLDESLEKQQPVGLQKCFEDRETIYPILSKLPEDVKKAWFDFDNYYSDIAFEKAIDIILEFKPKKVLDIGGNIGSFSKMLANKNPNITIGVADLPGQIELCKKNIKNTSLQNIEFYPVDMLDENSSLPTDYDVIWMSQFLDCFCEKDIVSILKKVKSKNTKICILEPLWDKQKFDQSAFCIINTSPYFTAVANGYSKMFNYTDLSSYIQKAGLKILKEYHDIGVCQSLLVCE